MNCTMSGVVIRELRAFHDQRGWLMEILRHDEMPEEFYPVMTYVSMTKPGVVRGPHEHVDQADYFAFIGPSTFRLYLWDRRASSPTFGQKIVYEFGEKRPTAVIVPKGVVHAYKNIGTVDGIVFNAPNRLYAGWGKKEPVDEIRHEDEADSSFVVD